MHSDHARPTGLGNLLMGWVRKGLAAFTVAVIESLMDAVDSVLVMVPNPVPTSGQLRHTRARRGGQLRRLGRAARPARRPVLAGVGVGELLVHRWSSAVPGLA